MWTNLLSTFAALLILLAGWVTVQVVARRFAQRHPESGAYREAGGGCGGGCSGCSESCDSDVSAPK